MKPNDKAVALLYRQELHKAPKIIASGRGRVAEKIIETARQAGIVIAEDPALVEVLGQMPLGDEIPLELYQAVAEVLAFVYSLESRSTNPVPGSTPSSAST